jgi:hypothetical protein
VLSGLPTCANCHSFDNAVDADGDDSVPVLLEGYAATDRAVNLPELVGLGEGMLQRIRVTGRLR